ncbi:MAG: phosphatase PAP2 family protein [Dongiaceae bacterium]
MSLTLPDGALQGAQADAAPSAALGRLASELGRSLRSHSLFILVGALHVAAAYAASRMLGDAALPFDLDLYGDAFAIVTAAALVILAIGYLVRVTLVIRPAHPVQYMWRETRARYMTAERIFAALPVFALIPLVMAAYSYLKSMIPVVAPFSWDASLAEWDRVLHGGRHPWESLQVLIGHPYLTFAVNIAYNCWYFVLLGVAFWQTFAVADPRLCMRYLMTLLTIWIVIGNVLAALLASGGPAYYGRLAGLPDPFAPLLSYLRATDEILPIWAVRTQDYLWDIYAHGRFGFGSGISAMPSVHVATSFSFALVGFAAGRRLGAAFALFAVLILIGSVHLGWHYAIDGYAAILLTWLIWMGWGRLLDRPLVEQMLWGSAARSRVAASAAASRSQS